MKKDKISEAYEKMLEDNKKVDEGSLSWLVGTIGMGIQSVWKDLMDKKSKETGQKEIKMLKKAKDKKERKSIMKKIIDGGKKFPPKTLNLIKNVYSDAKYAVGVTAMTIRGIKKDEGEKMKTYEKILESKEEINNVSIIKKINNYLNEDKTKDVVLKSILNSIEREYKKGTLSKDEYEMVKKDMKKWVNQKFKTK